MMGQEFSEMLRAQQSFPIPTSPFMGPQGVKINPSQQLMANPQLAMHQRGSFPFPQEKQIQ